LSRQVLVALSVNGISSYVLLSVPEYLVCRAGAITRVFKHFKVTEIGCNIAAVKNLPDGRFLDPWSWNVSLHNDVSERLWSPPGI
jgi:hypothetical protein